MINQFKEIKNKSVESFFSIFRSLTDKLSPRMKKAFCVVVILVWMAALIPVSLLKLIPIVGGFMMLAWCIVAVLIGVVVYDTWKRANNTDADK